MSIHVVGYKGVVGGATYQLFKRLGYSVTGSDKDERLQPGSICFVCVPETFVEDVIHRIAQTIGIYEYQFVVIRSTVTPLTCHRLSQQYNLHICHNPEFLRESSALMDEMNPARIVIGECCREHGDSLEQLYRPLCVPIVRTDTATSEMVKLACNNYFSTVISYWNTIEDIAQKMGISGHQVGMIAAMDPRISSYGARLHNQYGGKCLPKDAQQLIKYCESIGYDPKLIKTVEEVNAGIGGEVK